MHGSVGGWLNQNMVFDIQKKRKWRLDRHRASVRLDMKPEVLESRALDVEDYVN